MFSLWFTLCFFYATVILFTFPLPVSQELMMLCLIDYTCTYWMPSFVFFLKKTLHFDKIPSILILFSNMILAALFFISSQNITSLVSILFFRCFINSIIYRIDAQGTSFNTPLRFGSGPILLTLSQPCFFRLCRIFNLDHTVIAYSWEMLPKLY